jgi:putative Ca2+/H+ antiporter (TMEM165/GDT1 family)
VKTYVVVFVSVFIAELGDKTQLATLLFASDPAVSRPGVFVAAAGALIASTLLAVTIGAWLGAALAPERLKLLAGIGFVAIGLWMLMARA